MNRHQPNGIRRFVDLTFALATPDCFKLLDVTNKIANKVMARAFEARGESEQALHIREPLCAVEVCRDHSRVLRFINRKAQEIIDRVVMTTRNQATDQMCRPVQKPVLFVTDESNLVMFLEREKQWPVGGEHA